jgi:chorismate mutase
MDEIHKLRIEIDKVDNLILKNLGNRKELVKLIKQVKKRDKIEIVDKSRESEILTKAKDQYQKNIYEKILLESRKLQAE